MAPFPVRQLHAFARGVHASGAGSIHPPQKKSGNSEFILALGVKQLECAVVVRLRYEDLGGPAQVAVIGRRGVGERLRGGDAMLVEHHHEHLGIDDRAGVEKLHAESLTRITRIFTN